MQSSTKKFLWQEIYKGIITAIFLVIAAGISYLLYEKRLYEQQQKTADSARLREVQYTLTEDILDSSHKIILQATVWRTASDRLKNFRKLNIGLGPESALEIIRTVFNDSEANIVSMKEWAPQAMLIGIQSKVILGDDVAVAFSNILDLTTNKIDKIEKVTSIAITLQQLSLIHI